MAAGCFGSPGMRMMAPVVTTRKPAPALRMMRCTGRVKPFGAPSAFGSAVSENGVFATQTGRPAKPSASMRARSFFAAGESSTFAAP